MTHSHRDAHPPPRARKAAMTPRRWVCLVAAIALMAIAWFQVLSARDGLVVRSLNRDSVSLTYLAPQAAQRSAPGVLVAHGFAGSKQLMLGYGYTLAHSGYAVMLLDFDGHGGNGYAFQRSDLENNFQTAWDALKEQPEWDAKNLASIGHSLGSFATLSAAVKNPASFAATVAIAPVPAPVTFRFPRNLQLQVGEWETETIKDNAGKLLRAAGNENSIPKVNRSLALSGKGAVQGMLNQAHKAVTQAAAIQTDQVALDAALMAGTARQQITIPNTEHISILFSDRSHQSAIDWFDRSLGLAPGSAAPGPARPGSARLDPSAQPITYKDRRLAWFGLHWLAGIVAMMAIAPTLSQAPPERLTIPLWRKLLGLWLAPVTAALGLKQLNEFIEIQTLGGIQVGSAVALWLLLAGLVWLLCQGRLSKPQSQSLTRGMVIFGGLWIAFGALAHITWLPWLLVPARMPLWPLFSLAGWPWFMAAGISQHQAPWHQRWLWWLLQSTALVAGLSYTAYEITEIGFIALLLPFFPVLIAMFSAIDSAFRDPWSYALGCSLFLGWLLAALFPLA